MGKIKFAGLCLTICLCPDVVTNNTVDAMLLSDKEAAEIYCSVMEVHKGSAYKQYKSKVEEAVNSGFYLKGLRDGSQTLEERETLRKAIITEIRAIPNMSWNEYVSRVDQVLEKHTAAPSAAPLGQKSNDRSRRR